MAWVRRNAGYIIAAVAGMLLVPLMAGLNAWEIIATHKLKFVFGAGVAIILLMAWFLRTDIKHRNVWVVVEILLIVVMLPVVYGSGALLYDAQTAWKGDETHWHADFMVVIEGEAYNLIDPDEFCGEDYLCNLGNHTGGRNIHEHGHQRIHIHGPIGSPEDATLAAFFDSFGGELSATGINYPSKRGWINRSNTDGKTLKVFVERGTAMERGWEHLETPTDYIISPYKEGPVDRLVFAYDNTSVEAALQDVREDDRYRGVSIG